jgi:hypothetical protein
MGTTSVYPCGCNETTILTSLTRTPLQHCRVQLDTYTKNLRQRLVLLLLLLLYNLCYRKLKTRELYRQLQYTCGHLIRGQCKELYFPL